MKKKQIAESDIIDTLRKQIAGYEGAIARLCGIIGRVPADPTPENRMAALAGWMAEQDRKEWDFA